MLLHAVPGQCREVPRFYRSGGRTGGRNPIVTIYSGHGVRRGLGNRAGKVIVVKRSVWQWILVCGAGLGTAWASAPASAARWHEYLATTSVSASIDRASLRSDRAGHRMFLARTVLKRGERRSHGARYRPGTVILSRQEIDCRRQRIRLVDYVVRGPDGATLDSDTAAGAHWMRIRPGTLAARSAGYVRAPLGGRAPAGRRPDNGHPSKPCAGGVTMAGRPHLR